MKFNFDLAAPLSDLRSVFNASMDRQFLDFNHVGYSDKEKILNLGAGEKRFPWATPLQLPEWDAELDPIPYEDGVADAIIAFHFFEHISPKRIPGLLAECSRVLVLGGTLTIVVPHRLSSMAFQDLDHKAFFTENTWRILLNNPYYATPANPHRIDLKERGSVIFGLIEKDLALLTQFERV